MKVDQRTCIEPIWDLRKELQGAWASAWQSKGRSSSWHAEAFARSSSPNSYIAPSTHSIVQSPIEPLLEQIQIFLALLLLFRGFGGKLKPDFCHNLGIHLLQLLSQIVQVIPVVEQDSNLGKINWFWLEIIDVKAQQFHQSYIIWNARFCAMGKEGKTKRINSKMPLSSIGCDVETVAFGLYTGIASILHCLRIDDDQGCPFWLFFTCCRTCSCKTVISCSNAPASRHCL